MEFNEKTLKALALSKINRKKPYRPVKVVPHDPRRNPLLTKEITGWFGTEGAILGRTPEELERVLGFQAGYLAHGFDVFTFTRDIEATDFDLLGAYTYLPDGKEWDGKDLKWPPGLGVPQWKLKTNVPCQFLATVPRGSVYR